MMTVSRILLSVLLVLVGIGTTDSHAAGAAQFSVTHTPNITIPDGDSSGAVFKLDVSEAAPGEYITDLNVRVDIDGQAGFNGDLYLYLSRVSEPENQSAADNLVVLVNRTGREAAQPFGSPGTGFDNLIFDDQALSGDIHNYQESLAGAFGHNLPFIGAWQPDGRLVDPATVTGGDPRTTMLNTFNGQNPNGEWLLFASDVSPGGELKLNEWSLEFTVVPEPSASLLLLSGGLVVIHLRRCRRRISVSNLWRSRESELRDETAASAGRPFS